MDDLLVPAGVDPDRVELLEFVADADDHVRIVKPEVDVVVTHEPDGTEGVRVIVGEHTLAVKRGRHRETQQLGEAQQRVGRSRTGCSVPGQDDGSLARVEHCGRPRDLRRRGLIGSGRIDVKRHQLLGDEGGLNVLWHTEIHGSRPLGLGELERLADHLGDGAGGENQVRPLRHRREHGHQVDALMRFLVDPVQSHLGREGQHGCAVGIGVGRSQKEVDGAGPQGGRADSGSAGQSAVDLGHERRRLLVADQDVANGGPGQRIGEVDVLLPRDAEHTGDTLVLEALDEEFSGTPWSFSHRPERTESGGEKSDRKHASPLPSLSMRHGP